MNVSLFFNFDVLPGEEAPNLLAEVEAQVVEADRLGYSAIWLAEHHFREYGRMPAPLMFLARLSALTERVRLGTAVVEAPHYHPLRLAEDAALLDRLSGGRLWLGLGSGAGNKPGEFARFHLPLEEKGPRQIEIAEILLQALSGQAFSHHGTYYQYDDIQIEPQPIQPVHQVLAMAGGTLGTTFAGEHGLALLLPRPVPEDKVRDMIQQYRQALPASVAGRVIPLRFVFVAESEAEARQATETAFRRYAQYDAGVEWDGAYDTPGYEAICQRLKWAVGTPDQVRAQIDAWVNDLGADEIMGQMFVAGISHEDALRSMRLFAADVLPHYRSID